MSRYLVDQLGTRSNIDVPLSRRGRRGARRRGARGDRRPEPRLGRGRRGSTPSGLFIFIGADAETGWLPAEIALDPNGYVLTGVDVRSRRTVVARARPYLLETSVPGVFACGDVRYGPVKRVAAAVGEGSMAIAFVHQYLRHEAGRATPV